MINESNADEIWHEFNSRDGLALTLEQIKGAAFLFAWLKTRSRRSSPLDSVPASATLSRGKVYEVDSTGSRGEEILADGLDDREPGAEVSVMASGTVSAPEESL